MRFKALVFAVLSVLALVAIGCGSTASKPQVEPVSGAQQAAVSSIKPAAPKASSDPYVSAQALMSKLSIAIFNDSGSTYHIVATNGSNVRLDEVAVQYWGGPESGNYVDNGVKPLSQDTGGRPTTTLNLGAGSIREAAEFPQFNPGQKVTVKVTYPPGGTCVAATLDFSYKGKVAETMTQLACNQESGINAADVVG
jgi:hypothetical protein